MSANRSLEPAPPCGAAQLFRYASRMNTPTVDTSLLVRALQSAACAGSCVVRRSSTAIGFANHGAPSGARQPSLDWTGRAQSRAGFLAMQVAVPPASVRTPVVAVEQACLCGAASHSSAEPPSLGLCITTGWTGPVRGRERATRGDRLQPAVQPNRYASRMNTPTVDTSSLVRALQSAACAGSCAVRRSSTAVGGADHGAPSEARRSRLNWTGRAPSRAGFLAMQAAVPPFGVRTPVVAVEQACLRAASSYSGAGPSSLGLCITTGWTGPGRGRERAARGVRRQPAVQPNR